MLAKKAAEHTRQMRCLGHGGGGNTRQMRCLTEAKADREDRLPDRSHRLRPAAAAQVNLKASVFGRMAAEGQGKGISLWQNGRGRSRKGISLWQNGRGGSRKRQCPSPLPDLQLCEIATALFVSLHERQGETGDPAPWKRSERQREEQLLP